MRAFTHEEYEQVFNTNLIEYAKSQGYEVTKADRKSFRIKGYGGLYLFNYAYHHFSTCESGGIIDFAMKFQGLSKEEAIENILSSQGIVPAIPPIIYVPKGDLILPPKADSNIKTIKYLVEDRCLDPVIIDDLIGQGKIYTATTTNKGMVYNNCAFVSFYKDKPKYCALRGLGNSSFRQDVKNSDKSYGFELTGSSDRVFCFEAPIDAISHATICELNGLDYKADSRISEGCLSDKALTRFLNDNQRVKEIVFCFDNDIDGTDHMKNPRNHGQIFAIKCAEKFREQGYKTQIQTPTHKDWNEDLQYIHKSVIKELRNRHSAASTNMEEKQHER